jgi:hypothetical protein
MIGVFCMFVVFLIALAIYKRVDLLAWLDHQRLRIRLRLVMGRPSGGGESRVGSGSVSGVNLDVELGRGGGNLIEFVATTPLARTRRARCPPPRPPPPSLGLPLVPAQPGPGPGQLDVPPRPLYIFGQHNTFVPQPQPIPQPMIPAQLNVLRVPVFGQQHAPQQQSHKKFTILFRDCVRSSTKAHTKVVAI